ncbi:hypothetical protein RFI_04092 [Reticulomyxa filosa]|uniref:Uncharacterized protein n=1 Tax=Reticulomyxa filosa TaxID=46433 RepID=X6P3A1_RETFI|nr:hypothetical protein RFI_04092 [Reticulomyxa filosa]|eukprot:ETO33015.1 hypothetical protein RFI_04092 [Reticulomyxa filosa]
MSECPNKIGEKGKSMCSTQRIGVLDLTERKNGEKKKKLEKELIDLKNKKIIKNNKKKRSRKQMEQEENKGKTKHEITKTHDCFPVQKRPKVETYCNKNKLAIEIYAGESEDESMDDDEYIPKCNTHIIKKTQTTEKKQKNSTIKKKDGSSILFELLALSKKSPTTLPKK